MLMLGLVLRGRWLRRRLIDRMLLDVGLGLDVGVVSHPDLGLGLGLGLGFDLVLGSDLEHDVGPLLCLTRSFFI